MSNYAIFLLGVIVGVILAPLLIWLALKVDEFKNMCEWRKRMREFEKELEEQMGK